MATTESLSGLALHTTIGSDGTFRLSLDRETVAQSGPGEVTVRIEAAPINPSDIGLLLGAVDMETLHRTGETEGSPLTGVVPTTALSAMAARLDQCLPAGNEGAGTVVLAGPGAEHLLGQTIGIFGGSAYAQYRTLSLDQCIALPAGTTAEQGAAAFVNPVTALAMLETMRMDGHTALVHTAAASNLGQMLVKLCKTEGVPLVNIVRSGEQARILRAIGAEHVCNSTDASFMADLIAAIDATGATLAFDATGGGTMANDILTAMERSLSARNVAFNRYGSSVLKQIYVYGALDMRPMTFHRTYGLAWSVSGWLLMGSLGKVGMARAAELRARAAAEITTTFASHYSRTISLSEMLDPEIVRAFARRATGEKFLLNPTRQ
jgi:NADPH:quinone reductase-like Zn-dependent oxidoreductase